MPGCIVGMLLPLKGSDESIKLNEITQLAGVGVGRVCWQIDDDGRMAIWGGRFAANFWRPKLRLLSNAFGRPLLDFIELIRVYPASANYQRRWRSDSISPRVEFTERTSIGEGIKTYGGHNIQVQTKASIPLAAKGYQSCSCKWVPLKSLFLNHRHWRRLQRSFITASESSLLRLALVKRTTKTWNDDVARTS